MQRMLGDDWSLSRKNLGECIEKRRIEVSRRIDEESKARHGQHFTPQSIARFMASMFSFRKEHIKLLDAGAGIGSLLGACIERIAASKARPQSVQVVATEIDDRLHPDLEKSLVHCHAVCDAAHIVFKWRIESEDFLQYAATTDERFSHAVMNPPYFKINVDSRERAMIRRIGIETSNIYAGFVAGAVKCLTKKGELVAITPRSFCNGPYFLPFRSFLLKHAALQRIHVFESRKKAFQEVLQENVIVHVKTGASIARVCLSSSTGPDSDVSKRTVPQSRVVQPDDPAMVIHVAAESSADIVADQYNRFRLTLKDLGIAVSTGRVVDFRVREYLRPNAGKATVPLIYPAHFHSGFINWPNGNTRKPNAIISCEATASQLVPRGCYVLVKRFSAKEEPRRIVAAIFDPSRFDCSEIGFENHVNFFHMGGEGLPPDIARGLGLFLNSSLVDSYFRQFSGHTQVNATDLRSMTYPTIEQLKALGPYAKKKMPEQHDIDRLIAELD